MSEITLLNDVTEPMVVWATSKTDPAKKYKITHCDTLWPRCECEAGRHGIECSHVVALLESQNEGRDEMAETTAVVKHSPVATRALQVRETMAAVRGGYDDALFVAEKVIGRALWPEELRNDQQSGATKAALIVMTAAELGVSPIQAFSYIAPIKGKPFLMARMVNALVSSRVPGGYIVPRKRTVTECIVLAHRPGRPDVEVTITMEMAKVAGWTKNPLYASNPASMLNARATTTAGWLQFSDVLAGMDVAEEVEGENVPFFAAEVEQVPAMAIRETPAAPEPPVSDGDFREATTETAPETSGETQPSGEVSAPVVDNQEWIDDVATLLKGLNKKWADVGVVLSMEKPSRKGLAAWRVVHPEIADPVSFIRDALLREPVTQPELLPN